MNFECMTESALISRCQPLTGFSQLAAELARPDVDSVFPNSRSRGYCLGMSLLWLEYVVHKPNSDFFANIYDKNHSAFLKVAGIQRIEYARPIEIFAPEWYMEDRLKMLLPICGFSLPNPRDSFTYAHKLKEWKLCSEYMKDGWNVKGLLPRYFLLIYRSIHAMAVSVQVDGSFLLFDPNAGRVRASNRTAMAQFLHSYISTYDNNYSIQNILSRYPTGNRSLTTVFRLDVLKNIILTA